MNSQLSLKQQRLFIIWHRTGLQVQTQYLRRSINLEVNQWQRNLFHCMWRKEAILQAFKDASIIHLYKRKGNTQVYDNHRNISLLSIAWKRLAKLLLIHLNEHLGQTGLLPESQCGFRKYRGTMIFTTKQRKLSRQNVDLYMTFVDLTKAFDTVSRDGLRTIIAKFGCPTRFIAMVRQFHDGMLARTIMMESVPNPFR